MSNLIDQLKCLECGKIVGSINTQHLKSCCGMTLKEYKLKHPNAPTMSEEQRQKRRDNCNRLNQQMKEVTCSTINCNNKKLVKSQHSNNYICDECKSKGIKSKASIYGKKGSDIVKEKYKKDPSKKEAMGKKVSENHKKLFQNEQEKNRIVNQRRETHRKNTGYDHYMHDPKNVEHVFSLRDEQTIQETREKTNLKMYGVKTLLENSKFREKNTQKYFEKTGYYHWSQSPKGRKYLRNIGLKRHNKNRIKILEILEIKLIDNKYINAHHRHIWLCKKCNNKFKTCWNYIQQGYLCPICYPRNGGVSIAETEIFNFLQSILPNELILKNNKKIIYPYELDILIPNKKLAIEHNGLLWHSNSLKHNRVDKYYHITKTNMCKQKNIRLLHIYEDEWLYKQTIVMKRIEHILGVNNSKRIHGRKCKIVVIDSKSRDDFLESFHIQGKDNAPIRLGAIYNNELVAAMTFSRGNIAKGSKPKPEIWELNRFCINYNYIIPGIAGKLLKFFQLNYDWKKIYSYADLRWSEGTLYNTLGFNLESCTKPNYWYIKGYNRIHRYNLKKTENDDPNISEKLLRLNEGYRILYDCGSLKFSVSKW